MARVDPDRLLKEELQYELAIRGSHGLDRVKDMVSALRGLCKLEMAGKSFVSVWEGDNETEYEICKDKLEGLKIILGEQLSVAAIRKCEAKFAHIIARIERCSEPESPEFEYKRSELFNEAIVLYGDFQAMVSKFNERPRGLVNAPLEVVLSETILSRNIATSTPHQIHAPDERDHVVEEEVGPPVVNTELIAQLEKAGVRKWDVKFSGASGESVNALNELKNSRKLEA